MNLNFWQFVALGAVLMMGPMIYTGRLRGISLPKTLLCGAIFTAGGILGFKLMHFIENGNWDGRSFYGTVFMVPLTALVISLLLKLPFGDVTDLCPAAISACLALLKYKCYLDGCCMGKIIGENEIGQAVRFPSQLVEMGTALVLMILFLILARTRFMRGCQYGLFMLIYGIARFFLNMQRETEPFAFGLAAGAVWSILSVICGLIWIIKWFLDTRRRETP